MDGNPTRLSIDDVLKACCSQEQTRYAINVPFRSGDHVCATDGRICVRVPAEGRTEPAVDMVNGVRVPPIHTLRWERDRFFAEPVAMPAYVPPVEWVYCTNCDHGQCFNCSCGCGHDCGKCNGNGGYTKLTCVDLGPVGASNKYLAILRDGGFSLYPSIEKTEEGPIYFTRDDGVDGLLMPMRKGAP